MFSTRRSVLAALLTTVVAIILPRRVLSTTAAIAGEAELVSDLRQLVPSPVSARTLGLTYLKSFPGEHDPRILSALLSNVLSPVNRGGAGQSGAALTERAASRIAYEFEHEDIVEVAGWMLSRTEARLFALCCFGDSNARR
jgi:hypothetical protein